MRRSFVGFCVYLASVLSVVLVVVYGNVHNNVTTVEEVSTITPQPLLQAITYTTEPVTTPLVALRTTGVTETDLNARITGLLYHMHWLISKRQSEFVGVSVGDENLVDQVHRLERQIFRYMDDASDDRRELSDTITEDGRFLNPTLTSAALAGTTTAAAIAAAGNLTTLGRLGVGTTSPADTAAINGALYLADTTPANAISRLYNSGGDLYWNGSIVTSSSTGNWSASGGNVYRLTGNIGIGTTSPSSILHIDGGVGSLSTGLAFGDGDTGFFEGTDDRLYFHIRGITRWIMDADGFGSTNNQGPFLDAGSILASPTRPSFRIRGDTDTGIYIATEDELGITTGGISRVLVDASGNVGIGTTSPSAKLTIEHTGPGEVFRVNDEDGDTSPFVIHENGNVGVGTESALYKLYVNGTSYFNGGLIMADGDFARWGSSRTRISGSNSGGFSIYTGDPSLERLRVDANGNVGIGTTTPSSKLTLQVEPDSVSSAVDAVRIIAATTTANAVNGFGSGILFDIQDTNSGPNTIARINGVRDIGSDTSGSLAFYASELGSLSEVFRISGNRRVGVNDNSPDAALEIVNETGDDYLMLSNGGAGDGDILIVDSSGNVGIGTTSPNAKLHVVGDVNFGIDNGFSFTDSNNTLSILNEIMVTTGVAVDPSYTFLQDNNSGLFGYGSDKIGLTTGGVDRLTIDSSGNVGIGTTSPYAKFSVTGGSGNIAAFSSSGDYSEVVIRKNGYVGIGTTDPYLPLHVKRNDPGASAGVAISTSDDETWFIENSDGVRDLTFSYGLDFYATNTLVTFTETGNVGIGTTSPSAKLTIDHTGSGKAFWVNDQANDVSPFVIDENGWVGIGTSTPDSPLTINAEWWNKGVYIVSGQGWGTTILDGDYIGFNAYNYSGMSRDVSGQYASVIEPDYQNGGLSFLVSDTNTGGLSLIESLKLDSNGNVGIGTTSPYAKLSVSGDLALTGGLYDSSAFVGDSGMILQSLGAGVRWVATSTLGLAGTFTGLGDTQNFLTADRLIFTNAAGTALTDSSALTFDGTDLSVGAASGFAINGSRILFAGPSNDNVFLGEGAGNAYSGSSNTIIGDLAAGNRMAGDYNTIVGAYAGQDLATSSDAVIIGGGAAAGGGSSYQASGLTIVGTDAGYSFETGANNNTFFGYWVGNSVTTGANNLLLGYRAGDSMTTGSNNILIGYDIEAPSNIGSNQLNIGNLIFGTSVDGTGTTISTGNIGIGSSTPGYKLSVAGTVYATSFIDDGITIGAPDYVFDDPNYNELTLAEIEAFIADNDHLPWLTPRDSGAMSISSRINEVLEALENLFLKVFELVDWNEEQDVRVAELEAENEAQNERILELEATLGELLERDFTSEPTEEEDVSEEVVEEVAETEEMVEDEGEEIETETGSEEMAESGTQEEGDAVVEEEGEAEGEEEAASEASGHEEEPSAEEEGDETVVGEEVLEEVEEVDEEEVETAME